MLCIEVQRGEEAIFLGDDTFALHLEAVSRVRTPLVTHADGLRLAKRDRAPTLAAMREAGVDGPVLARDLATGLVPSGFRLSEA